MSAILRGGTRAPDFRLPITPDKQLSLGDLRGKPVILAFYPADWSPVCGDQMALYNEVLPEFQRFKPKSSAFLSTAYGATRRSRRTGTFAFHYLRILSRRVESLLSTAPTAPKTVWRNEPCL